jgi:ligand-binding sensor domain-containing protein
VASIAQDKYGYMWFAIRRIRAWCDMMDIITTYRHDPKDSNSLGTSSFECIAADASGNIWIEAAQGVDKFDFATKGLFITGISR